MRVLLTTDTIGGVWTFTRELSTALLDRGHQVALVSFGRLPSPTQDSWIHAMRAGWGVDSFCFHASDAPLEWMQQNESAYAEGELLLLQITEDFQPDLFHSSQFCWGALPIFIPKVITAHSDVVSWGVACRPDGLEPSAWLGDYCSLVQAGLDKANAVIAPTHWMLEALRANFALPATQHVILNGRQLPEPRPTFVERHSIAITAGRFWDEAKNLQLLTRVAAPLPIQIAGGGPPYFENLTSLGVLDQTALILAFRSSSIYICPSLYEPFGLAPLEAALCGCAVVANDIPSLREVWGDAALYFRGALHLQALLEQLVSSPHDLAAAQRRSQTRARQLTAAKMAEAYLALYRELSVKALAHA